MITSFPYPHQPTLQVKAPVRQTNGLSRVFAAAVVNRQFCQFLLQDPAHALQNGYMGETFQLSDEERVLLVSIRAESLPDLARKLGVALDPHARSKE
ncbi:MAG TPA: hypothetical protein PKL78_08055 [Anaerolineales bacterium]|nr:hypothetical protein [Anaerolineales bacterium]HNN13496.1 hypothetical protein [Anaerolineales bacterium]HNO31031.1 hypothetical protein [Anaerolineales bacterium]